MNEPAWKQIASVATKQDLDTLRRELLEQVAGAFRHAVEERHATYSYGFRSAADLLSPRPQQSDGWSVKDGEAERLAEVVVPRAENLKLKDKVREKAEKNIRLSNDLNTRDGELLAANKTVLYLRSRLKQFGVEIAEIVVKDERP